MNAAVQPLASELSHRVAALREQLAARDLAAAVLASPEAIYYLTGLDHLGYFAPTILIVPSLGAPVIVTREMERPTIRAQLPECEHATFGDGHDPAGVIATTLASLVPATGTVGIEQRAMFFPPALHQGLLAALPAVKWHDLHELLGRAMAVKSPAEVDLIRRAAAVSDAAMAAGLTAVKTGVPEGHIAADIHHAMFTNGGQQPGFDPLVRPLSMLNQEHVTWGPRTMESGLFLELSGCVRRYHAPLARTVYIGHPPPGAAEAHDAAVAGLVAVQQALRPGALTGEVYDAWQQATGVSDLRHHCGYQIGIGFPPSWVGGGEVLGIRPGGDVPIRAGMTFHVLSWILPSYAMSDTMLVTDSGTAGAEALTTTPRELMVVT